MAYRHDRHDSRHHSPRRSSSPSRCRLDVASSPRSKGFAGTLTSVRFAARRVALALASRFANRRFAFATSAVSVVGAKVVHLYAHFAALPVSDVLRYGLSFFSQDAVLLLVLRLLLDGQLFANLRWLGIVATTLATVVGVAVMLLASVSISFFAVAGSELHWRNIAVASDSNSWAMLLTGLFSCSLVLGAILFLAWALQDFSYIVAGMALDIIKWPFSFLLGCVFSRRRRVPRNAKYEHVPQDDVEGAVELKYGDEDTASPEQASQGPPPASSKWMVALYVLVGLGLLVQAITTALRPDESSLSFMSWTLPLLPFVDFAHSSPTLAGLLPFHGSSINLGWDNRTALAEPVPYPWLPKETPLPGFEDWYDGLEHYRASDDPLKISNLDDELLPELRAKLRDVKIRHVMLIKLESTRKDVFPLKKGGIIWEKLQGSFKNESLPQAAYDRLATLTQNANFLTGDYGDGFQHAEAKQRGGLNVNNAHTTSTYTLKSLAGTHCGLTPLVADFNVEASNHIYQPCLAHIFNAFNQLDHGGDVAAADDFTSFKWRSMFMQSVTNSYDKQDAEMPALGFAKENIVDKEYLQSEEAKFGKVNMSDINYYGMPEIAIKDYIRDAFASAKKNNERVFLSHLTSTTHHPFGMPKEETYVPLASEKKLDDLSGYVNAVGYVDRWLGQVLGILEDEGVADETLLVLVGDHGLSVAENGGITPYYNPNIGNFHVPMVFSHPKLPHIDINDAVVSLQILPTILDLLMETGSLSKAEKVAAHDLVHNYEGQSLIRPLRKSSDKTGEGDWQYTVMNPGRATLSVRDARKPNYRLIVPIVDDTEWRFTDISEDPHEDDPLLSFGFNAFLHAVEEKHGIDAAKWAEEGAFISRWWVEENSKRWRYEPN